MFCQNCGTKNKPGAKFCAKCGTLLRTKKSQPTAIQNETQPDLKRPRVEKSVQPTPVKPIDSTGSRTKKNQGKKKGWLIWIIILVIALGAGGAYYYFSQQSDSNSNQKSVSTTKSSSKQPVKKAKKSKKPSFAFPKSTVEGTIDDAFGDLDGTTSVYVSPTDTDEEVVSHDGKQRAASNIKLFIMVAAFEQIKAGDASLDDKYALKDSDKVGGTGSIRDMDAGTKISYQDLLEYMMEDSDNTAANIVINKIGGMDAVNDAIDKMGVSGDTKLERMLMDNDALEDGKDNYTSAKDLGIVLKKIYNHQMVSRKYDDQMLAILKKNKNHTKLPNDLPDDATIYNKTGEFDDYGVENDAAILGNHKGSFVVVVMSEDGDRDDQVKAMSSFGSVMYKGLLE